MKTARILAVTALSAFAAFGAHADEADGSQFSIKVESQRSRAEVQAEARNPVKIGNGSTGVLEVSQSGLSRADVRAEAASALRAGMIPNGEASLM
ncbi:MAG: DUF4148 domain-containing protein [Ramlibacter sp.]|jgi:hypothetical protein